MTQPATKLYEVAPREQVGARTGSQYDYQYHRAAGACLDLLEDDGTDCVFCEWHDDFVTQNGRATPVVLYGFHQVKTRQASKGPWKIREVFGLSKPKKGASVPAAQGDSIVARLFEHFRAFTVACDRVVLITNAALDDDFSNLVGDLQRTSSVDDLVGEAKTYFPEIFEAYRLVYADLTKEGMLDFLRRFQIKPEAGNPSSSLQSLQTTLSQRIVELSEIDLRHTEAIRIGRDLVELVRAKSHAVLSFPTNEAELKSGKGIVVDDVLRLLSLSTSAYAELRKGDSKDLIRSLSRLHRICERTGIAPQSITDICRLKTDWDVWHLRERHNLQDIDLIALKDECGRLLRAHVQKDGITFAQLVAEASALAVRFKDRIQTAEPLTGALVLGRIFALAVELDQ